jgi:predicted dehydrogenase
MTAPRIRIGFIGASSSSRIAWANITHIPYLLSEAGQSKYEIVAICNSSLAAGQAAIAALGLPATTKVYDSASALAADTSVDLVVCSVHVSKHYELIKPALLAGKMAFVEWPLGVTLSEAAELAKIAEEKGARTVVGLQGRMDPVIDIIKSTVDSGKIGDVLSSNASAVISWFPGAQVHEGLTYLLDSKSGATLASIVFAHCESFVRGVLC